MVAAHASIRVPELLEQPACQAQLSLLIWSRSPHIRLRYINWFAFPLAFSRLATFSGFISGPGRLDLAVLAVARR